MYKIFAIFSGLCLISMSYYAAIAQEEANSAAADVATNTADGILKFKPYRSAKKCSSKGVAVGGYDLISYREEGGPRYGLGEFKAEYGGGIYLFESAEHRETFLADPMYYLPNYGGWCAISMALGKQICPDYSNFKIETGDLLVFEVTVFSNGRALWNTDPPKYRAKANTHYKRFIQE